MKREALDRCLTLFEQPSLSVRIKEGVCEIVPVVHWDLKWFAPYALVQFLKEIRRRQGLKTHSTERCSLFWFSHEGTG